MTSDAEKRVLNHLADAWGCWLQLDDKHPDDVAEFRFHVHALQNLVAWRVARRVDPQTWGWTPSDRERAGGPGETADAGRPGQDP